MKQTDFNIIWKKILSSCKISDYQKLSLKFLGEDTKLMKIEEEKSRLIIVVKTDFIKAIFENEFYAPLVDAANLILNSNFTILFLTNEEWKIKKDPNNSQKTEEITLSRNIPIEISSTNQKMCFENFIVSKKNKMLIQAALAVSTTPGLEKWNPFFIYGKSGLGKTHLLHAIGNKSKQNNHSIKIKYFEARHFGELIHDAATGSAISQDFESIKNKYLNYDLLLVDDIQMIQNWKKVKEIFFTIFSSFINNNKQIVITSDQYVDELRDFEERFITRFQGGLSISVSPPDIETSKEIIKLKLKDNHNFNINFISDEAIEFVATHFGSNVRELEGAINRIIFWTIQNEEEQSKIQISEITEIFQGMVTNKKRGLTVNKIILAVGKYYNIPVFEIKGKSRKSEIMNARHISIYLIKTLLDLSVINIGKEFARDHSTILSSINKIKNNLKENNNLSKAIYEIRKIISYSK